MSPCAWVPWHLQLLLWEDLGCQGGSWEWAELGASGASWVLRLEGSRLSGALQAVWSI